VPNGATASPVPNGAGAAGLSGVSAPKGPGPAKAVPAPAVSAEQAVAAVQASTTVPAAETAANEAAHAAPAAAPAAQTASVASAPAAAPRKVTAPRRPSGRERHDEKITVYVSPDELLGLEHARIMLRGEYGLAVDRGRIVREAVAALLADLDARGRDSILVKRLSAGG
jgi:hypothetical protein